MVAGSAMVYKLNESIKQDQAQKIRKVFQHLKRQLHSSLTRSGKRKYLPNSYTEQDRTFQRCLSSYYQYTKILDQETLTLCNENIS
ncbi:MAG: hypothetical protein EZS28_052896 [Streblomastix strix]|uniref:Uncharacterized protein n=1 Tax=Streblomastix strix TaxID=222440 RepID=A0A5J4RQI0_9EUKA|nr:MAG: hypothetical protein EZS28_052896 [Streblomastix strix]